MALGLVPTAPVVATSQPVRDFRLELAGSNPGASTDDLSVNARSVRGRRGRLVALRAWHVGDSPVRAGRAQGPVGSCQLLADGLAQREREVPGFLDHVALVRRGRCAHLEEGQLARLQWEDEVAAPVQQPRKRGLRFSRKARTPSR